MTLPNKNFPTDHHGWAELLPSRPSRAALTGNHRHPWVVVGAGLTGLACARRLAELHPDEQILLLDARCVAQGASGRNSGFVVSTSHFPGKIESKQIDNYQRINRINRAGLDLLSSQVSQNQIECQWQRAGFIHTAVDQQARKECENFRHYLDTLKVDYQPLNRAELEESLGTKHYQAGIRIGDGGLVQPAALVCGLADTLPANVTLHEQSPVLKVDSGKPIMLHLANAQVKADKLLLATNYEAPKLGFLKRYIIGSTLAGSFTRQLNAEELASLGNLPEWGAISLHSGGATVRLTKDHRISIRNTAEYHGSVLLSDNDLLRRRIIHRQSFDKRFPQLAQVPFEYSWSGVEGISRNGTNFFGEQRPNIYLAGGYNGSGVSRGTAFGTAIADYANGNSTPLVNDCLASAPGVRIPPRPLLDIGAFFTVRSRFKGVGEDR